MSRAGGGSLPDKEFQTFAVQIRPELISVNDLEKRLRHASPPVIAKIRGNALLIDARTVREQDIKNLLRIVTASLSA
jgi:L-seryl-tRNA(Ser) seleniumtransferase